MRDHIKQLIFIAFVLLSTFGFAQQYNFRTYTVEDGLTQSQVKALIQDKKGNLWIGTSGAGVSRFDGISFTNYSTVNGLIDNNINQIVQDDDGTIWLATNEGISCFDGKDFTSYSKRHGLLDNKINSICIDVAGNVWAGTNKGLNFLKADQKKETFLRFKGFTTKDGLASDTVKVVYENNKGKIWLGTSRGINIVTNKKGTDECHFKIARGPGLESENISAIVQDKNSYMWFGTTSGVFKLITKSETNFKFINYSKANGLVGNSISAIAADSKGNIWLGTDMGCSRIVFENNLNLSDLELINYDKFSGLADGGINVCLEDRDGNIWFGTENGLSRYSGSRFVVFNEKHGLSNNTVWSVLGDNDGDLWLGTDNAVTRLHFKETDNDHPEFINYSTSQGFSSDNTYYYAMQDRNNNIWFGTSDGVLELQYDKNRKKYSSPKKIDSKNDFNGSSVYCILEDSRSNLWFTTSSGVIKYDGEKFKKFTTDDGLADNIVYMMLEDRRGQLWFGTKRGLCTFDGSRFGKTGSFSGLRLDVSSMEEDENGYLWLGSLSGGGVTRFDGETFFNISESDGLVSNIVYLLMIDNSGYLWIGTNKGIDRFDLPEFNRSGKKIFRHYSKDEGFAGIECNQNAVYKDYSGNIWFGTVKGVVKYNVKEDVLNEKPPLTHITSVGLINQDAVSISSFADSVDHVSGLPVNLVLPYNINSLMFEFLGICLTNPEKVRYKFMLKGLNDVWSSVAPDHQESFYNLAPGDYTFMVQASNNDGQWNYDPVLFSFKISPPFWRTIWFYVATAVLSITLIWLFIWYRTAKLQKSKRILEEKIKERTQELQEKNIELNKLSIVARETVNAIAIANPSAEIEWVNEGFTRLTGYTLNDLIREKGPTIYSISHNPNLKKIILDSISSRQSKFYESLNVSREGREIWIHTTLTPIFGEDGRVSKLVFIDTDITEMKKAEELILQKNKDILDSINYAKLIQNAILPSREEVKQMLPLSFILFKPREVVSGDFYWVHKAGDVVYIASVDCTGHGVPGAFMSMIGTMLLNEIVNQKGVREPAQILNKLNEEIRMVLKQDKEGAESRDGMDIALCALNTKTLEVEYAGAMRPLYIIRKAKEGEEGMLDTEYVLTEIKPDKVSIGGGAMYGNFTGFTNRLIQLQKDDNIYMFTDGYPDQFGGARGRKITNRYFKQMLLSVQFLSITRQEKMLDQDLQKWMGNHEQVDDILVVGIKV